MVAGWQWLLKLSYFQGKSSPALVKSLLITSRFNVPGTVFQLPPKLKRQAYHPWPSVLQVVWRWLLCNLDVPFVRSSARLMGQSELSVVKNGQLRLLSYLRTSGDQVILISDQVVGLSGRLEFHSALLLRGSPPGTNENSEKTKIHVGVFRLSGPSS